MTKSEFFAHKEHRLADHLNKVGRRAAEFAIAFGGAEHAKIAGLLHDLGKAEDEFQKRLRSDDKEGDKEPHAHHGAMIALEKEAWPIALAINGHHAGLHNRGDVFDKMKGYLGKAKVSAAALHESDASWSLPEIAEVLPHWLKDLTFNGQRSSDGWMATEFFTRFLFSALIDADRLDAEQHEKALDERSLSPQSFEKKWGGPNLRSDWPGFDAQLLLDKLERNLAERAENALREGKASADVLRVRNEVGDWCRRNAASERGLFSLAVPTGGGKTLASMLFALSHAAHHNGQLEAEDPPRFRRVIVVIPYLSIIEQTVGELIKVFGKEWVLEHHSQADEEDPKDYKKEREDGRIDAQTKRRRLAAENWDAPIIVTTSVQFFGSLFSRKPSKARKLHNICQSVVIFDEVQTLPPLLLQPLLHVLGEVANPERPYGCTLVFCTATQPALKHSEEDLPCGLKGLNEIVPSEQAKNHYQSLKRVKYRWPESISEGPTGEVHKSWDEIATEILAADHQQALAVVNTRGDARELHAALKKKLEECLDGTSDGLFHLSTWMMPSHRRAVLDEVRDRLERKDNPRCLLVSTQCIEAGVDVDFPEAWRAFGPYDSIVQVAGRCNRNGKKETLGIVHVFHPTEDHMPLKGVYRTATSQTDLLRKMRLADPDNPDSFEDYFRLLYQLTVPDECLIQKNRGQWRFKEVHQLFKFIDDDTVSVLVLNQTIEGQDYPTVVKEAYDAASERGFFLREDWRRMQGCIINLPHYKLTELQAARLLGPALKGEDSLWLWSGAYDGGLDGVGLTFDTFYGERTIL